MDGKNGMLVHELVHALDLASGRYHRDSSVRERRVVFLQKETAVPACELRRILPLANWESLS